MRKFSIWNTIAFLGFVIRFIGVLTGDLLKLWEQIFFLALFTVMFGLNIYQPRKAEK